MPTHSRHCLPLPLPLRLVMTTTFLDLSPLKSLQTVSSFLVMPSKIQDITDLLSTALLRTSKYSLSLKMMRKRQRASRCPLTTLKTTITLIPPPSQTHHLPDTIISDPGGSILATAPLYSDPARSFLPVPSA